MKLSSKLKNTGTDYQNVLNFVFDDFSRFKIDLKEGENARL